MTVLDASVLLVGQFLGEGELSGVGAERAFIPAPAVADGGDFEGDENRVPWPASGQRPNVEELLQVLPHA